MSSTIPDWEIDHLKSPFDITFKKTKKHGPFHSVSSVRPLPTVRVVPPRVWASRRSWAASPHLDEKASAFRCAFLDMALAQKNGPPGDFWRMLPLPVCRLGSTAF